MASFSLGSRQVWRNSEISLAISSGRLIILRTGARCRLRCQAASVTPRRTLLAGALWQTYEGRFFVTAPNIHA